MIEEVIKLSTEKDTKTKPELLTIEEYLTTKQIHEGLLASFLVEAKEEAKKSKTESEWDKSFENQSKKIY